ncbi:TPA: MFS transporter [Bacillus cereus]|uniref:Sugar (And other) transporter family protein n=2 Tax=Bacillus cereus TaxID=1396 RepID=A0AAN0ST31_BACCE|nr:MULTISPECIES: MFS transporter [Bacillus cereus group]ABK84933.1 tetracycline resistance protein [Bacillus thuringiensis str. Al Hakam]AEW54911.1 Tetracycline resistance protein [Bacillus cereus F837/76]AJG58944.1 sugar (and other) transporter family protein [Bacillus cereus D17]AJH69644.1 sugar (and other) transporter family protein [Bacillus thuringiensis]AJI09870.1 sugar (and other) transporter family protein [Bacillus cereus 03BB108]
MIDTADASISNRIYTEEEQQKLYKRTLLIVSISQMFGGAGLAAGITVGALLAQQMLGTDAYAGLPAAMFTMGSAVAAFFVGKLSQKYGRRVGLAGGFIVGGLGAIGVVMAALTNSIILLLVSLLIYGAGTATNLQARYAGTDLANKKQRATAISITMVMTTFGAVAGPNLVGVMGRFAHSIGIPELAGPFILSATAFILAGLVLFVMLRPDPLLIANMIETYKQEHTYKGQPVIEEAIENKRGITVGAIVMILTQVVMVAIMTMTPVHMGHHGHGLSAVGLVIGFHVGAMYLPSLVTGMLIDKIGRTTMSIAGGVILLAAGVIAAIAPSDSLILLIVALSLLGLGWNLGLISGTAQIVDATIPSTRAKTQGKIDVFIALAGASGGAMSGMVVANSSYAALSLAGGVLAFMLIPVVIWARTGK